MHKRVTERRIVRSNAWFSVGDYLSHEVEHHQSTSQGDYTGQCKEDDDSH
jgi:hypothetical protein